MAEALSVGGQTPVYPQGSADPLEPASNHLLEEEYEIPSVVEPYLPRYAAPHWLSEARCRAKAGWGQLRRQLRYWKEEYPEETLFVVAGLAFAVGVALRIRRSR